MDFRLPLGKFSTRELWRKSSGFLQLTSNHLVSRSLVAIYLLLIIASLTAVEHAGNVEISLPRTALLTTILLLCLLPLFFGANFSFGYLAGVVFSGMIVGFVWLTYFTTLQYDHEVGRWVAIASLVAFLFPMLFQIWPAKRSFTISVRTMDIALRASLLGALLMLILDIRYGLAFVTIEQGAQLRSSFSRPALVNYLTNNFVYAILPFAYAFFWQNGSKYLAIASLLLIAVFYLPLLNKTVLFAAVWLPFIQVTFRHLNSRVSAVAYLLVPLLIGLLFHMAGSRELGSLAQIAFGYLNERMFAVPSIAMDYYAEFFTTHPNTYFCQINIVRFIGSCPYSDQLGVIFNRHYGVGNLNASFFATEGIASVGLMWTPVVSFFCGVALSVGNSVSRHLSPSVVATSSGLALQALLNVPLSTALLTNGVMLLFMLWYICPGEQDGSIPYSVASDDVPADFRADCIFEDTPLRFRADDGIDAIVGGRVVAFENFEKMFNFLRR